MTLLVRRGGLEKRVETLEKEFLAAEGPDQEAAARLWKELDDLIESDRLTPEERTVIDQGLEFMESVDLRAFRKGRDSEGGGTVFYDDDSRPHKIEDILGEDRWERVKAMVRLVLRKKAGIPC